MEKHLSLKVELMLSCMDCQQIEFVFGLLEQGLARQQDLSLLIELF